MIPRAVRLVLLSTITSVLILGVCGCSTNTKVNRIVGRVTYHGEAVDKALVTFHPVGASNSENDFKVKAQKDGSFVVLGMPAGEYTVAISRTKKSGTKEAPEKKNLLPERYGDPHTSGIQVTVHDDASTLEPFQLE